MASAKLCQEPYSWRSVRIAARTRSISVSVSRRKRDEGRRDGRVSLPFGEGCTRRSMGRNLGCTGFGQVVSVDSTGPSGRRPFGWAKPTGHDRSRPAPIVKLEQSGPYLNSTRPSASTRSTLCSREGFRRSNTNAGGSGSSSVAILYSPFDNRSATTRHPYAVRLRPWHLRRYPSPTNAARHARFDRRRNRSRR